MGVTAMPRDLNQMLRGQVIPAGSIIVRRELNFIPDIMSEGVEMILFAKISGVVQFERVGRDKKRVSVYPVM